MSAMSHKRISVSTLLRQTVLLLIVSVAWMAEPGYYQYGNLNGNFYVWTTSGLQIYDPLANKVIKTLTDGPKTFGDAVFIRDQALIKHYAFVAESSPGNKMHVYDTTTHTRIANVAIGANPVHVYALPAKDEVWAHLDAQVRLFMSQLLPRPHLLLLLPTVVCHRLQPPLCLHYFIYTTDYRSLIHLPTYHPLYPLHPPTPPTGRLRCVPHVCRPLPHRLVCRPRRHRHRPRPRQTPRRGRAGEPRVCDERERGHGHLGELRLTGDPGDTRGQSSGQRGTESVCVWR